MCKHPVPSTLQIGKAPPSYSLVVVVCPETTFCLLPYTFFSAVTCVHRRVLHELLKEKIAQYTNIHKAPAARNFSSGAGGAPDGETQNGLSLAGCRTNLIAHLLRTPAAPLAGDNTKGVLLGQPGSQARRPSAWSWGGPASFRQVCQRKSPQSG